MFPFPNMLPSLIPTIDEIIQSSQKNLGKSSVGRSMTLPFLDLSPKPAQTLMNLVRKIKESQQNGGKASSGRSMWNIVRNAIGNGLLKLQASKVSSDWPDGRPDVHTVQARPTSTQTAQLNNRLNNLQHTLGKNSGLPIPNTQNAHQTSKLNRLKHKPQRKTK